MAHDYTDAESARDNANRINNLRDKQRSRYAIVHISCLLTLINNESEQGHYEIQVFDDIAEPVKEELLRRGFQFCRVRLPATQTYYTIISW